MTAKVDQIFQGLSDDGLNLMERVSGTRDLGVLKERTPQAIARARARGYGGITKTKNGVLSLKMAKVKTTRSLNSFMAFRCFYSSLFEEFQQKVISTYIVFLWESDPFKAKWAIVAKAYSAIRDVVGKEHAPLDSFLMLVTKFVGIIEPHDYLIVMGWEILVNGTGTVSLTRGDFSAVDSKMLSTTISVEDIISFAGQHGYAGMDDSATLAGPSSQPTIAMAAAAQPAVLSSGTHTSASANTSVSNIMPAVSTNAVQNVVAPAPQVNHATNISQPVAANAAPTTATPNFDNCIGTFAFDDLLDWDPEANLPIFDPFDGDPFDAFDMSAWINDDAFAS
ncbi:MAG: hypothetical protein Q9218_001844 [Villophora microphyllina]